MERDNMRLTQTLQDLSEVQLGKLANTHRWMENYMVGRQMRTFVSNKFLTPVMFLIYMNNLLGDLSSYMIVSMDNARVIKQIRHVLLEEAAR